MSTTHNEPVQSGEVQMQPQQGIEGHETKQAQQAQCAQEVKTVVQDKPAKQHRPRKQPKWKAKKAKREEQLQQADETKKAGAETDMSQLKTATPQPSQLCPHARVLASHMHPTHQIATYKIISVMCTVLYSSNAG